MNTIVEKIDFFDQVAYSVQPSKYEKLGNIPFRKVIMYLMNLATILSIMTFIIPVAGFFLGVGGPENLIMETLPAIELRDGRLSVGNKIEVGKGSAAHILVDTSIEEVTLDHLDREKYSSEVIVGAKNILLYSGNLSVMEYDFTMVPELVLNNESLLSAMPMMVMVLVLSFLWNILATAFRYLFSSMMLAIVCWGPFSLRGTERLNYKKALTYTIYAKTAAELFTAFNGSVGIISNSVILVYGGMFVTVGLLISGIRRAEGKKNE